MDTQVDAVASVARVAGCRRASRLPANHQMGMPGVGIAQCRRLARSRSHLPDTLWGGIQRNTYRYYAAMVRGELPKVGLDDMAVSDKAWEDERGA